MKRKIIKWILRITITGLVLVGILLVIILQPIVTYASKTNHNNFVIFHNKPLDPLLKAKLDEAVVLLKKSEFYDPSLKFDICLNDGSTYPQIIKILRGQAFGWGFYNKVVLQGVANYESNYVELNGYKWNLTQLLVHELVHCLQFQRLGLWKSKPIADIPDWKWEGYAEYISRQGIEQKDFLKNMIRLTKADRNKWGINFEDSTISPKDYYENWILVQFCIDIKKMNYQQLISDLTSEEALKKEMMLWFNKQDNKENE